MTPLRLISLACAVALALPLGACKRSDTPATGTGTTSSTTGTSSTGSMSSDTAASGSAPAASK